MKKILSLFGVIALFTTTLPLNACDMSPSGALTSLNSVITKPNLGPVYMVGWIPFKWELLNAIKEQNPDAKNLTLDDFLLQDIPTYTSVIIVGSGRYGGKIELRYSKSDLLIDLNDLITITDLGDLGANDWIPTKEMLLLAIKLVNPKAWFLTTNDFGFKDNPTSKNAVIVGVSRYKGEVSLEYKTNSMKY